MKTTVVPAQITSVEDRIAGNFTFSQVILLIFALLISAALYLVIPPRTGFSAIKISLIAINLIIFCGLAIRWNGKIVAQWLVVYFQFTNRPRIYTFTKNDLTARSVPQEIVEKKKVKKRVEEKAIITETPLTISEQLQLKSLIDNSSLSMSFELSKKGGVNVSLSPTKD